MLNLPVGPGQGGQQGLGQRDCLLCSLHYHWVTVTQSPTHVMQPTGGQGREALTQLCWVSTLSLRLGRMGGWGAVEPEAML